MKINVRRNTFETNSSSMHSLSILPNEKGVIDSLEKAQKESDFKVDAKGTLYIKREDDLEFGWGFDVLISFYDKLCYAIASICDIDKEGNVFNMDIILNAVQEYMPEIKKIQLPESTWGDYGLTTGYVDHESVGTVSSSYSHDKLVSFLFDSRNIVFIDNDNNPHTAQVLYQNCETLEELKDFLTNKFDPDLGDSNFEFDEYDYDER